MNSRPPKYVSTEDVEEPITPSHLITGRRLMSLPDGPYNRDIDDTVGVERSTLTKRMIHHNKVLDHFWKRWNKEYLLDLRNSHRQMPTKGVAKTISVGDIVLVHDADHPRGFWKLGRVEDLIAGSDGRVRGASICLHSPTKRHTRLQRPIQLLYPLEVHSTDTTETDTSCDSNRQEANPDTRNEEASATLSGNQEHTRPKRLAAQNARDNTSSNRG